MIEANRSSRHAVAAGLLGWTLDAFDFFVVVFLVDTLAAHFGVGKKEIIWTITMTLAMRPVGAVLFGFMADRFGRRGPLMANVIFFSVMELLCGFAPNYTTFLVLRALFGIGMGGEWGVGASMAMEHAPVKHRGVLSGILQSGYSMGYLLAAMASRWILPLWGWRAMFWIGGVPALLAFYVRWKVPESEAFQKNRAPDFKTIARSARSYWKSFLYLVLMMMFMNFLSHGTQDLFPDFLKSVHHVAQSTVSYVAIIYNIGAIVGAVIFGRLSETIGRRRSMIAALVLAIFAIPLWVLSPSVALLTAGAFLMQAGVQGAWGIIPVHLNELVPLGVRGLLPGLAYQLGILLASPTSTIEYALRDRFGYSSALAGFEVVTIVILAIIVMAGKERRGRSFLVDDSAG